MPFPHRFNMKYRPDIDGIRAIAVLSVLVFHIWGGAVPGGFAGVDVFFVISGYLITKGLADEIGVRGRLSLVNFYYRRIRRIGPALAVVLAVSLVAGYFVLLPGDYEEMGESAMFAAFGLSNFYFYNNTGYFDPQADLQPLLHTWSLGVEEQFYVVWPAVLMAGFWLARGSRKAVAGVVGLVIAASWCTWIYKLNQQPNHAFYQPHARAWELALGALLVFVPAIKSRLLSEGAGVVGLVLVGTGLFLTSGPLPNLNVIPAVVGSALLIWPKQTSVTASFLSLSPMRWTGLISYSLYLWHWPVLVFFRHANGAAPGNVEGLGIIAASFILAYLTWRFVEKPMRRPWRSPVAAILAGVAAAGVVATAALTVYASEGFANRLSGDAAGMASLKQMWNWDCPSEVYFDELEGRFCTFGAHWNEAKVRGIVWGDSHAEHMAPMIEAGIKGQPISFLVYPICPVVIDRQIRRDVGRIPNYTEMCAQRRANAMRLLAADPSIRVVVFSSAWASVTNEVYQDGTLPKELDGNELVSHGLDRAVEDAAAPGRKFILLAQTPSVPVEPIPCLLAEPLNLLRRECGDLEKLTGANHSEGMAPSTRLISAIAQRHPSNTIAVLPGDALCRDGRCVLSLNGQFLYRDTGHLRRNLWTETKEQYSSLIGLTAAVRQAASGN